jgi:NADH-quinone oxidoreductase subunit H
MNNDFFGIEMNVWAESALRLLIIVGLMTVIVMGLIYAERKIIGRFQQRLGPTRTGPFGLLQSVADALKLIGKEDLRPRNADPFVFELAPYVVFIPIFMGFIVVPFVLDWEIRALELGLLFFVAISSVNIVGWVMAGWGSDNRYAMIGGMRAAAQAISYELPLVLALLSAAMVVGTLNLQTIVAFQDTVPLIVWQPLAFVIFFIAALAELNRSPFDIPVGESEVVGGPFVEYSGIRWSMFFLAEYAGLFIMALIASAVFLGGWAWPLGERFNDNWYGIWWQLGLVAAKAGLLIFVIFWIRATLPRLRIDQLMGFSWKVLLPLTFVQILVNGLFLVYEWTIDIGDVTITTEAFLLPIGLAGVAALYLIIERGVSRPRPRPAASAAPSTPAAPPAGAEAGS